MSGTTGTIPLQDVIDDQLITPTLWNGEFANISALLDAAGAGGHSDTDADAQIQTAPYPGSVLSKATSIAGELERIRYVLAQILGKTYWYQPAASGNNLGSVFVTGEIRPFGSSTVPTGFLACDGSSYLRTDYADLFTAIGSTWGAADGTHFNVPDLRGRALIGSGTGSGLTARSVGQTGGEETHLLITSEIPAHNHQEAAHNHGVTDPTHSHSITGAAFSTNSGAGGNGPFLDTASGSYNTDAKSTGITINNTQPSSPNTGGGGTHNNMQPWACVGYIIKT